MLSRIPIYLTSFLCVILVYILFAIKDNVMKLNKEYVMIKKQISYEASAIKMLRSELSYLSSPERLQTLSNKYLSLETVQVTQIISDFKNSEKKELIASNTKRKHVKWRKKQMNMKYSIKVSY